MSDEMENKTPDEISEIFAIEVAGWGRHLRNTSCWVPKDEVGKIMENVKAVGKLNFATDANAVLPWLEKHRVLEISKSRGNWNVTIRAGGAAYSIEGAANAPTFPLSACIALIRAKRAEKGEG